MGNIAEAGAPAGAAKSGLLFGHEAAQRLLRQQWASGHMHHALLLEGEQGIGKATLAFHFAYHILDGAFDNAAAASNAALWPQPDENAPLWRKMRQGAHPNLLYISRSQDRKTQILRNAVTVDDIRRISRFLQQTAADNGWRIIIIDPADDMNRNAANALLKTLEEPPLKTLFLLVSHNFGRLLPTIRSRCQWLHLKPLDNAALRAALAHNAQGLYEDAAPQSRDILALADGSVGHALLLLAEGGAEMAKTVNIVLRQAVFSVPQAQKLAETLSKRDNAAVFTLFLDYIADFIHNQAVEAARAGRSRQAARLADFFTAQEQTAQEALAFNLDKKQFILVLLQQIHDFLLELGLKSENRVA